MAKANLEWSKPNIARTPKPSVPSVHAEPSPSISFIVAPQIEMRPSVDLTKELVIYSAVQQQATDYAIDGMCGEVTWGVCERRLKPDANLHPIPLHRTSK
mgnify:CR=1 FL=1